MWGALHGSYLLINHAWRSLISGLSSPPRPVAALGRAAGAALTFLAVVVAWVFFRATTFDGAARVLRGMTRLSPLECARDCYADTFKGFVVPPTSFGYLGLFFAIGFALVWLFPTSQATTQRLLKVHGVAAWVTVGFFLACISLLAMINASHHTSEFIYFNF